MIKHTTSTDSWIKEEKEQQAAIMRLQLSTSPTARNLRLPLNANLNQRDQNIKTHFLTLLTSAKTALEKHLLGRYY